MKGTALITGGAVRLGKILALNLAGTGFNIALHYNKSQVEARETATEIKALKVDCKTFQYDFFCRDDFSSLIKNVKKEFPDLNLLINNASAYKMAGMLETDRSLLEKMLQVNFIAPYLLSAEFARECGKGNIINIIDNKIAFNQFQYSGYLLSKKSLAELTKLAACELAPDIRVNAIAPGVIMPAAERTKKYIEWRIKGIPLRRIGSPVELSKSIDFILDNEFVTGQIITIDGGESLTATGRNLADYKSK